MKNATRLIVGCGYLGMRVAQLWRQSGCEVVAVTRQESRAREFERAGLRPIVADVTRPETLANLPAAASLLYAVGFDRQAGPSMRSVYVDGLAAVLDHLPADTQRVIYVSSTGVYGQTDGSWIDEDSPCLPRRENGQICLAAEEVVRQHPLGGRALILRMAGLYGPGRVPYQAALRSGEPLAVPQDGYLNLVHIDDAARAVVVCEKLATPPRTYLVADGQPVRRGEYYAEVAQQLGAPAPRFATPAADSPAQARAGSDKRISNRRLVEELGFDFTYPSYREGLKAILATEEHFLP